MINTQSKFDVEVLSVFIKKNAFFCFVLFLMLFNDEFIQGDVFWVVQNRENILYMEMLFGFRVFDILVFTLFISYFWNGRLKLDFKDVLLAPFWLFFIPILVSTITALYSGQSQVFASWKNYLIAIMFLSVFLTSIETKDDLLTFIQVLCTLVILRIILEVINVSYFQSEGISTRKLGYEAPFFYNRSYLLLVISLCASAVVYYLSSLRSLISFNSVVMIFAILVIVLSFSRSSWGMLTLCLGLAFILQSVLINRINIIKLFQIGIVLIFASFTLPLVGGDLGRDTLASFNLFSESSDVHSASNQSHINNIEDAFGLIDSSNILFGAGSGGVDLSRIDNLVVHNAILFIILKFGLFGFLLALFMFVNLIWRYLINVKYMDHELKIVSIPFFSTLVASLLSSMLFEPPFLTSFSKSIYIFIFVGILTRSIQLSADAYCDEKNSA